EPVADHRPDGDPAPDAAAHEAERLSTAMQSAKLDRPRRGACVQARFAEALKHARQARAGNPERKQVNDACHPAACEAGEQCDLAPARIGERSGDEAATKGDETKNADDESDGLVRPAKIVPHMRSERGQNGADAEKPEKGRRNETPKAQVVSGGEETHEA